MAGLVQRAIRWDAMLTRLIVLVVRPEARIVERANNASEEGRSDGHGLYNVSDRDYLGTILVAHREMTAKLRVGHRDTSRHGVQ